MRTLTQVIDNAKTATEIIDLQVKVQMSTLTSEQKRPYLRLLDAKLALHQAKDSLGHAYVEPSDMSGILDFN